MRIIEIWTRVKAQQAFVTGNGIQVVFRYETFPCAQHCGSYLKAVSFYIVRDGRQNSWY